MGALLSLGDNHLAFHKQGSFRRKKIWNLAQVSSEVCNGGVICLDNASIMQLSYSSALIRTTMNFLSKNSD